MSELLIFREFLQACKKLLEATWFEAHRETEVDNLQRGVLRCVGIQEVLRLEVPVHDAVLVAMLQMKRL